MADIAPGMLEDFIAESHDLVSQMSNDLLAIDASIKKGRYDPERLNGFFRAAHSIKGIAGVFGFAHISELAHTMESFLDRLRLGKIRFSPEIIDLLFEAIEAMGRCIEDPSAPRSPGLDRLIARFQAAETPGPEKSAGLFPPEFDKSLLGVLTEYEQFRLTENLREGAAIHKVHATFPLMSFDEDLEAANRKIKERAEFIATLPSNRPVPSDGIGFDLMVAVREDPEGFLKFLAEENLDHTELSAFCPPSSELPPDAGAEPAETPTVEGRAGAQTVRVATDKLDVLMNMVGELLLVKEQLGDIAGRLREAQGFTGLTLELHKLQRLLERKLRDLQSGVMDIRMTPIAQLFDRVARVTRQTAREAGKEIQLVTEGRDVELDKLIIDDLSDPLMHIIRNAIDHGIEDADDRAAAGKPLEGRVRLSAAQRGNYVTLTVRDDGCGMDPDRIKAKAIEKGLLLPGAEPSRREIYDLIFQPGFSTKEQATRLSGRGVGMDVVKKSIQRLGGFIHVDSTVGQGTSITLSLPITLAIIQALVVQVAGHRFAVPLNAIIETVTLRRHDIQTLDRREVIEFRGHTLPLLRLWEALKLPAPPPRNDYYIVVIGVPERMMGVMVEEILNQQDIVVKSMGCLRNLPGIAGATELGNQETVLVLDVNALIDEVAG